MSSKSVNKVKNSLLVLTQTLEDLKFNLRGIIEESFKYTNENLYVYFNPLHKSPSQHLAAVKCAQFEPRLITTESKLQLRHILKSFYQSSFKLNPKINVTCLLNNVHALNGVNGAATTKKFDYDMILTDLASNSPMYGKIHSFCDANLPNGKFMDTDTDKMNIPVHSVKCDGVNGNNDFGVGGSSDFLTKHDQISANKVYPNTIMGGTFDRLHIGHKIMLSEAILVTENRLLIGVTTESMLKRKKLAELIQSYELRCENLTNFLSIVAGNLDVLPVALTDPFGPSIVEKDYQCLVVSRETFKTGEIVNKKRVENKLNELEIHVVELIEDSNVAKGDEDKVSSSNQRRHLLGTLLKPPYIPYDASKPYVIGLTGGLASGKSTIGNDLKNMGSGIINCDLIGHLTYERDTPAYFKIIQTFGPDCLDSDAQIDRKQLGAKVFNNADELKKLTDIVWPEIQRMVHEQTAELFSQGFKVIVVEAALLIDAKWHRGMNEVWVCFVSEEEAIERAMKRDGSSLEKVRGILHSQMKNSERIDYANVVFSSMWEREYTQSQVERAWGHLRERTGDLTTIRSCL